MLSIHPSARTADVVRIEIPARPSQQAFWRHASRSAPRPSASGAGAKPMTGRTSSRPHKPPWKATNEERAIIRALRNATGISLDDLTFVVIPFLHL